MNKKELKSLIKEVVKETMAEMMLEMNFGNIIENALSKGMFSAPVVQKTQLNESPRELLPQKVKPKTDLRKKLGISESEWKNVYADIAESDSPILSENRENPADSQPKPPEVSVNDLAEAGLYRDYSKFL